MAPSHQVSPGIDASARKYLEALPREPSQPVVQRSSWRMVFVIAVLVLLVSVTALGSIALSYFMGQQKYNALSHHLDATSEAAQEDPLLATVDWKGLLEANPDTVAWIYIPNTDINYPVVRGTDNEYYLSHDFDGTQGWLANFGTVFMDYRDVPDWTDQAYFFYGHHMNDGSMFADIASMADQGFFDSARTIYLYSPAGNFKLRSYSLVHCGADDPLVQVMFPSAAAMADYVQDKMDRSIVDAGEVPAADAVKKSFAFSTCDNYSMGRYVLFSYIEKTTVFNLRQDTAASSGAAGAKGQGTASR